MSKEEVKIQSTTNYEQFKKLLGNRPINKSLIVSIRESINNDGNYLMYNPIIVNEEMEIIDGQHRLEAAQQEGKPIYYVVAKGMRLRQAQVLNSKKRQWIATDYLHSYLAEKRPDYIVLKELIDEYKFSVPVCVKFLSKSFHESAMRKFRDGSFEIVDRNWAEDGLGLLSTIREYSPDYAYVQSSCQRATALMLDKLQEAKKPRLFEDQLKRYQTTITRRNSAKDYLKEFQLILDMGGDNRVKLV